ncbi:MAG: c-type cytochrome [Rhodoferax sp.]|nr:c-type cytochrome [Rhodoferax sp.]
MARGKRPRRAAAALGALLLTVGATSAVAQDSGSATRGQALYESRCGACHSVDANRVGPMHKGVLGRMSGSVAGYDYSPALAQSHFIWTREKLLLWLKNPEGLVPGQKMNYQVDDAQDRADLVAYLATLK